MNLSIRLEIIMDIGKDAQDKELLLHLGRLKDLQERVEDLRDMILAEFDYYKVKSEISNWQINNEVPRLELIKKLEVLYDYHT